MLMMMLQKKNVYKKGKKEEFLSLRRFHMPPLTREWREFSDITRLFLQAAAHPSTFVSFNSLKNDKIDFFVYHVM